MISRRIIASVRMISFAVNANLKPIFIITFFNLNIYHLSMGVLKDTFHLALWAALNPSWENIRMNFQQYVYCLYHQCQWSLEDKKKINIKP